MPTFFLPSLFLPLPVRFCSSPMHHPSLSLSFPSFSLSSLLLPFLLLPFIPHFLPLGTSGDFRCIGFPDTDHKFPVNSGPDQEEKAVIQQNKIRVHALSRFCRLCRSHCWQEQQCRNLRALG